jgi:hypothetical protein
MICDRDDDGRVGAGRIQRLGRGRSRNMGVDCQKSGIVGVGVRNDSGIGLGDG